MKKSKIIAITTGVIVIVVGALVYPSGDKLQGRFFDFNPRAEREIEVEQPYEERSGSGWFYDFFDYEEEPDTSYRPDYLGASKTETCASKFGGEWDVLLDAEYKWVKIDAIEQNVELKGATDKDINNIIKYTEDKKYTEYCYTQESISPIDTTLSAVRKCEVQGYFQGGGLLCTIFSVPLPKGPPIPNNSTFFSDMIDITNASVTQYNNPVMNKVRTYSNNSTGQTNSVLFIEKNEPNNKYRITIQGRKKEYGQHPPKPDSLTQPNKVQPYKH